MPVRPILARATGLLVLWLVLAGWHPADLPAACVAVMAATWVSLRLAPPEGRRLSWPTLAALVVRFPMQSLLAGIDVAWRAFSPALPMRVGTVAYVPRLPPGPARDAFLAYASTMPGTVPVDADGSGQLLIHCLDTTRPVARQMAEDEARFRRAAGHDDG